MVLLFAWVSARHPVRRGSDAPRQGLSPSVQGFLDDTLADSSGDHSSTTARLITTAAHDSGGNFLGVCVLEYDRAITGELDLLSLSHRVAFETCCSSNGAAALFHVRAVAELQNCRLGANLL